MGVLEIILIVLEVIASLALIVIVLFQSGKEAGIGALSGNAETYLGKGKAANWDKKLATATKWVALVWVLLTLVLSFV